MMKGRARLLSRILKCTFNETQHNKLRNMHANLFLPINGFLTSLNSSKVRIQIIWQWKIISYNILKQWSQKCCTIVHFWENERETDRPFWCWLPKWTKRRCLNTLVSFIRNSNNAFVIWAIYQNHVIKQMHYDVWMIKYFFKY